MSGLARYRAIDVTLFACIVCALEAAAHFALKLFPGEVFTLSATLPVALIVLMRWGVWGVLHAALGGLIYSLLLGGSAHAVLAYTLGGAFVAANLLWFRFPGKERVRASGWLTAAYAASGWLLMNTGRALIAAALAHAPFFGLWVRFLSVEALGGVMTVIVLLVARRRGVNGSVFEDQRAYCAALAEKEGAA